MQNNKPLRPHLSLKIEDNMGQKIDAGAIWFKTGSMVSSCQELLTIMFD